MKVPEIRKFDAEASRVHPGEESSYVGGPKDPTKIVSFIVDLVSDSIRLQLTSIDSD